MPDGGEERAPAWEFGEHRLTILPGTGWDEWQGLWSSADRMSRSINFWVGDALNYALAAFPDTWSQVVDEKYIHQQHGPMWVCSRIEAGRRRAGLSYSMHRELAAIRDPRLQDEWLDRAEAGKWTVKQLKQMMAAAAYPKNGAPADPPADPENSTWNQPGEEDEEGSARNPTEDEAEAAIEGWLNGDGPTGCADDTLPGSADQWRAVAQEISRAPSVADLRACIEDIRTVAKKLALNLPDPDIHTLPGKIAAALGVADLAPNPLHDVQAAIDMIPDAWRAVICMEGGEKVFGGRKWTVELQRRGGGLALGIGPWLAASVLEAAIAATISDLLSP
jgi:hypothetical protein